MGNIIFIKERRVCVKPLRSRLKAFQKLKLQTTNKCGKSFLDMANFLNLFCPKLQQLSKPICDLPWKGRQFIWGEEK